MGYWSHDGLQAVMDQVLKKLEGKDLLDITLDIDVLDMAYVPATNSSEPTGLTPQEFLLQSDAGSPPPSGSSASTSSNTAR